ncbi:MAG TPA: hypothetical protein VM695_10575 [Phycisphaerae bacterium]|nr:hypothetical protein [Phycisphaerae bacterium]
MHRSWILGMAFAGVAAASGCGGDYILTVPDQVAPAGGETVTVVRLQRNDFFVLAPAVEEAAMRFRIGDGPLRAAYTDNLGYAAAAVSVPEKPGRHTMTVAHLDMQGDEAERDCDVYVWDPSRPVVAVDMDCLPGLWLGSSEDAAKALRHLVVGANLLYLTRQSVRHHRAAHETLTKAGYPVGPILTWQREHWHIVRDGPYKLPRVVVEGRLVSQLPEVRKVFPHLATGVCDSALAAKAFAEAGLSVVMVGKAAADVSTELRRRESWSDLAAQGP